MLCSRPSFLRKQEGGFTFQVQHTVPEDLCGGLVRQALAGRIVVGLDQVRKPRLGPYRPVYESFPTDKQSRIETYLSGLAEKPSSLYDSSARLLLTTVSNTTSWPHRRCR